MPLRFITLNAIIPFFLLIVVVALEQVWGMPLAFLSLSLLWLEKGEWKRQLVMSVVLSLILGTVYFISFVWAFVIFSLALWLFPYLQELLVSRTSSLLIVGGGSALVIAWLSSTTFSWFSILSGVVSLLVVIILSKLSLLSNLKKRHL